MRIIGWIMNGVYSSFAIFILSVYLSSPFAFKADGKVADIAHLGGTMYTCLIWAVNSQIALMISHFTWIQHLFIWGSIFLWYVFLLIYGELPPEHSQGGFHLLSEALAPTPMYWLTTLVVVVVSLLPYLVHVAIQRLFYPMDDHLIQEIKYCKKDVTDSFMWSREQMNSKKNTHVGFSARVDAKIRYWKEQLHHKKQWVQKSVTKSPFF